MKSLLHIFVCVYTSNIYKEYVEQNLQKYMMQRLRKCVVRKREHIKYIL